MKKNEFKPKILSGIGIGVLVFLILGRVGTIAAMILSATPLELLLAVGLLAILISGSRLYETVNDYIVARKKEQGLLPEDYYPWYVDTINGWPRKFEKKPMNVIFSQDEMQDAVMPTEVEMPTDLKKNEASMTEEMYEDGQH